MLAYVRLESACPDVKGFKGWTVVGNNLVAIEERGVNMKLVLNYVSR